MKKVKVRDVLFAAYLEHYEGFPLVEKGVDSEGPFFTFLAVSKDELLDFYHKFTNKVKSDSLFFESLKSKSSNMFLDLFC